MKKRSISLGPGAASLILVVMVLSMTALGTLTLMSARNDHQLGSRSIRMNEEFYTLQAMAEKRFFQLDTFLQENVTGAANYNKILISAEGLLPENAVFGEGTLTWREELNGRQLTCTVLTESTPTGVRLSLQSISFAAETEEIWN